MYEHTCLALLPAGCDSTVHSTPQAALTGVPVVQCLPWLHARRSCLGKGGAEGRSWTLARAQRLHDESTRYPPRTYIHTVGRKKYLTLVPI